MNVSLFIRYLDVDRCGVSGVKTNSGYCRKGKTVEAVAGVESAGRFVITGFVMRSREFRS